MLESLIFNKFNIISALGCSVTFLSLKTRSKEEKKIPQSSGRIGIFPFKVRITFLNIYNDSKLISLLLIVG